MDSENKTSRILAKRAAQVQRGSARAAVLGVNDGLVSILCLTVGVAAAGGNRETVITAGLAGLLAGAISMAAGEWVSVNAQVELFRGVLNDLKVAIKKDKQLLTQNLAHALAAYGVKHEAAHKAAQDVADSDDNLTAVYSAQVIGLNPDELGSPWRSAASSFVLFVSGAMIPLSAWLLGASGARAIIVALILTSAAGLFVGGFTAYSSGRSVSFGSFRQLGIIIFASAATYGIGYVFGVTIV